MVINGIYEPWEGFLASLATVAMVTRHQYFSCCQGPKAHLHAKFHEDRVVNKKKFRWETDPLGKLLFIILDTTSQLGVI